MNTTIDTYNGKIKSVTREILSKETIVYSLIFFFLSIIFFHYVHGPLINSLFKAETEIHVFVIIPSNLEGVLYWAIRISVLTPYLIFIYRRKYGSFILGFCIPSLLFTAYTWHLGGFQLDTIYDKWSFYYLIPAFVLIYLLRRSKTLKEDIVGITFFVLLIELLSLCSSIYYFGSGSLRLCASFTVFTAVYLILLSFAVEKIAKVKIFRHTT